MKPEDLAGLAAPVREDEIEWRPGATNRDKTKALALAYVTSRAVQDRFDAVCGPADWRNEFRTGPDGGVVCALSVRIDRLDGSFDWVTKEDGAENTDIEGVKGGLSGSLKRAAVMWGFGRSLYSLPNVWAALDERGRFVQTPRLPGAGGASNEPPSRPSASAARVVKSGGAARPRTRPEPADDGPASAQAERIADAFRALSWSRGAVTAALAAEFGVEAVADVAPEHVEAALTLAADASARDRFVNRARRSAGAPVTSPAPSAAHDA